MIFIQSTVHELGHSQQTFSTSPPSISHVIIDYALYILLNHMCYLIVLMSSLLFYNVENSKNEEKPLNE